METSKLTTFSIGTSVTLYGHLWTICSIFPSSDNACMCVELERPSDDRTTMYYYEMMSEEAFDTMVEIDMLKILTEEEAMLWKLAN